MNNIPVWIQNLIPYLSSPAAISAFLLFIGSVWLITILWVIKDSSIRVRYSVFRVGYILVGSIPIVGAVIYILLRPSYTLLDIMPWREAIINEKVICPYCGTINPRDHLYCFSCGKKIQTFCRESKRMYPLWYQYSPYSGEPNIDTIGDEEEEQSQT